MMGFFHMMWSAPLRLVLCTILLWHFLGIGALTGLLFLILLMPLNAYIGVQIKCLQARQMQLKDERIKLINELLNGIKVLKMYGWEPSFEAIIQNVRNAELKIIKKIGYFNALTFYIWQAAPFLVGCICFLNFKFKILN